MKTISITTRFPGVAQISLDREKVFNAFNEQMITELDSAFEQLGSDQSVRAIVLSANGSHFSVGADVNWLRKAASSDLYWNVQDARKLVGMLHRIATTPKTVIAEVHGRVIGGGVGLICACDIAIGTNNSTYSVAEAKLGIIPSAIGPYLINAIGKRHAQRLALSCTKISALEAVSIGLIHKTVESHLLHTEVNDVLEEILLGGPVAQAEIKQLFSKLEVGPITGEVRELTALTISRIRGNIEAKDGLTAFLNKTSPSWVA